MSLEADSRPLRRNPEARAGCGVRGNQLEVTLISGDSAATDGIVTEEIEAHNTVKVVRYPGASQRDQLVSGG